MTFDAKKALESWKKAKPLLLTDTGVSDHLRKLPDNPMSKSYLADLDKAGKKLDTFMADAKIKAEKKAVACLKEIQASIEKHVKDVVDNRKHVLGDMDGILAESKKYVVEAIKSPTREALTKVWIRISQLEKMSRLDPREHDHDPPLRALMADWHSAGGALYDAHDGIIKLMDFNEKKPMADFQAQLVKRIKHFGDQRGRLEKLRQAAGSI